MGDELCGLELECSMCRTYKHTFTCYKNNDNNCGFGDVFWSINNDWQRDSPANKKQNMFHV